LAWRIVALLRIRFTQTERPYGGTCFIHHDLDSISTKKQSQQKRGRNIFVMFGFVNEMGRQVDALGLLNGLIQNLI
jgi:hypothetical protein